MELINNPIFSSVNTNRLAVALASITVNLGARNIHASLSPRMQEIVASRGMRMVIIAAMFFLSTRDVMLSVALSLVFCVVISTILDERSEYSLITPLLRPSGGIPTVISRDAYDIAVDTVLRFRHQARGGPTAPIKPLDEKGSVQP